MPAWQEATHPWSKQKQAHTHTVSADRGLFVCHLTCWHLLQVCHHIVQSDAYKAVPTLAGFPWSWDRWDSGESKDVAMVENWPSEDRRLHHYDYEVQEKLYLLQCVHSATLNDYQGLLKHLLLLQTTSFFYLHLFWSISTSLTLLSAGVAARARAQCQTTIQLEQQTCLPTYISTKVKPKRSRVLLQQPLSQAWLISPCFSWGSASHMASTH